MEEIWKDIPGYEGHYLASNLGNIKSLKNGKEKILSKLKNHKNYFFVRLSLNNKKKIFKVHQLVAMAFLNHEPCGLKRVVDHINNNVSDNRLSNLRIISNRDNCHRVKNGLNTSKYIGVIYDKIKKRWRAQASIKNKRFHIGYYSDEETAAKAYKDFIITLTLSRI